MKKDTISIYERKYYIWGTGAKTEWLHQVCANELKYINVIGYIDNDVRKQKENSYKGKSVHSPEILKKDRDAYLIVFNDYYREIIKQINNEYPWYRERVLDTKFFIQLQLMKRYEKTIDKEIIKILRYLEYNFLLPISNDFISKYKDKNYDIEYDQGKGLFYTLYQNKRMYFARSFQSREQVNEYFKYICAEQDEDSPHKYLTKSFDVPDGAIVIDAGAAEGNFALSIIDRVKKIYLFEPDQDWVEALQYTFCDYMDKVEIINKAISNYQDDGVTTIDDIVKEDKIDFIKMDIEGEEYYALQGASNLLQKSTELRCSICTYHLEFEFEMIKKMMEQRGFEVSSSKGYMWFPSNFDLLRAPVLRKGILRARRI